MLFFMAKKKAHQIHLAAGQEIKPRKSIPVDEVNELIDKFRADIQKERTIYNERKDILRMIEENENELEHYENLIHNLKLARKGLEQNLASLNKEIARKLDFDEV